MKVGEFVKLRGLPPGGLDVLNGHVAQIITVWDRMPSADLEVRLPDEWPANRVLDAFRYPDHQINILVYQHEYEQVSGPQYWFYEQDATV